MKKRTLHLFACAVALIGICAVDARGSASGPLPGLSGAPGEATCIACHLDKPLNGGGGGLQVQLLNASSYTPGQTHRIRVTLTDPVARRWGFQLTARTTAGNQRAGNLATENAMEVVVDESGGFQYIRHTILGTRNNQANSATWEFQWTAPLTDVGNVTFYAAANAANANGNSTGDNIYTTTATIAASNGSGGNTTTKVLPLFTYGSPSATVSFYTGIYVTNTTNASVSVPVRFRTDEGMDVNVPGFGAAPMLNVPANGTAVIDSPATGAFSSGWAEITLPPGVVGYGVFRQVVPGRFPQEAVVPLSDDSKIAYNLTFDDTSGLTTSFAVANPGDTAINVQLVARDLAGVQLGAAQLTLQPRNKQASRLIDVPGLASVAGKRGSLEVRIPAGKLTVMGLRFGEEAFTSIPVDARQ